MCKAIIVVCTCEWWYAT